MITEAFKLEGFFKLWGSGVNINSNEWKSSLSDQAEDPLCLPDTMAYAMQTLEIQ